MASEPIALLTATPNHEIPIKEQTAKEERKETRKEVVPKVTTPRSEVQALVEAEFGEGHIMVAIARAESQFTPTAKNPKSTATGVFQILIGTWNHYQCTGERTNPHDNIRCARKIYDREGTRPWNASKHMW